MLILLAVVLFLAGFFYFPLWLACGCVLLFILVDRGRVPRPEKTRKPTRVCMKCGAANRVEDYRCLACGGPL